ncbi:LacI family DNA-binding transcriptional regulator [Rariglobus hedericola]|uniref:LacI family transcriptional regulator n=1 Tax=Rariglobus hedericola TaxID=2597822 RepID=A0A556QRK9_9BACT|nr:LacI family DNA-binding transcriptional regulator [Rariglobus hedericola]TSJ79262.1 LacI family transcriptional regulator [Rariglobus hedericola]
MADVKKRITIAEVARRAGVSRTAVSYALRDDPNIAVATRERIRKVADALGYRPDPTLAKLMAHLHGGRGRRYAGKLAFLNVHEDCDYWRDVPALSDFRRSAETRAGELGYETEEFWLYEPGRTPKRLAQMLIARGIRGLVVGSTGRHGSVVDFPWAKFAAVTVGYSVAVPALHRVVTHHYRNTRLALAKATADGARKIGLVTGRDAEAAMEDLHLAAFLAYQQEVPAVQRVPPLRRDQASPRELSEWFARHRPDVVLSTADGVDEFASAGIRVPQDTALVKLLLWADDTGEAGVLPGYDRLGGAAVNLLTGQLQHDEWGVPADPKIVQVEGRWREGASFPRR